MFCVKFKTNKTKKVKFDKIGKRVHRWRCGSKAIQENGLIKREQSDARISSAEREDGRPKVNGTTPIDWFAMLKGWERARNEN